MDLTQYFFVLRNQLMIEINAHRRLVISLHNTSTLLVSYYIHPKHAYNTLEVNKAGDIRNVSSAFQ